MRKLPISELIPGMITADDVYNYSNQIILPKGMVLTDLSITRLEFYSIISVKIEDDSVDVAPNFLEDLSYREKIMTSPAFHQFKQNFENTVDTFSETLSDIVIKNDESGFDHIWQMFEAMSNNVSSLFIFDALQNLRNYDDVTFAHCLNVGLLCNLFAQWLNFSIEDQKIAVMSGLLHDIGKTAIQEDIIKKPSKLTDDEYAAVQTHPLEGFRILRNFNIDKHIKNAALMHHEKCDGSGYPQGLKADDIDPFAKIVAIADVYDAMTSARIYRGPLCPFHVIEIFEQEGLQKYDPNYIITFLKNVVNTYIQNRVLLNDGREGEIVMINPQQFSHPIIKCGNDYLDLSKRPDLYIKYII